MKYAKIFVIGFNKTASTTLHQLFKVNNLKSQHATSWDLPNYDCFSDNGNLNDFKQLDNLYKDAIFILNTRNLTNWLISRFKHGHRQHERLQRDNNWAYPCTSELAAQWIKDRETYYLQVLDYFKDRPNKLIIISIEDPNWKQFVSDELGIDNKDFQNRNVIELHDATYYALMVNCINAAFATLNYKNKQQHSLLCMSFKQTNQYLRMYKNNIII
jgi:hypothetical protein